MRTPLTSGGKRDPMDASDRAAAERETLEEIGLALTTENSIYCGGLEQYLVSSSGSTIPLMVLCPYGILPLPFILIKCIFSRHQPFRLCIFNNLK